MLDSLIHGSNVTFIIILLIAEEHHTTYTTTHTLLQQRAAQSGGSYYVLCSQWVEQLTLNQRVRFLFQKEYLTPIPTEFLTKS